MSSTGIPDFPDLTQESILAGAIDDLLRRICDHLQYNMTITWSWKVMGKTFGKAFYWENRIELNPLILTLSNSMEELKDTVIHEACHIVAAVRDRSKGHQMPWKILMLRCGIEPNRCGLVKGDDLKVWNLGRHRRFRYICPTCEKLFKVSATVHNRVLRGWKYKTRCCNAFIEFASSRETEE